MPRHLHVSQGSSGSTNSDNIRIPSRCLWICSPHKVTNEDIAVPDLALNRRLSPGMQSYMTSIMIIHDNYKFVQHILGIFTFQEACRGFISDLF